MASIVELKCKGIGLGREIFRIIPAMFVGSSNWSCVWLRIGPFRRGLLAPDGARIIAKSCRRRSQNSVSYGGSGAPTSREPLLFVAAGRFCRPDSGGRAASLDQQSASGHSIRPRILTGTAVPFHAASVSLLRRMLATATQVFRLLAIEPQPIPWPTAQATQIPIQ